MKKFYIFCARLCAVFGVKTWAIRVRTPAPFNNEVVFICYRTNDFKRKITVFHKGKNKVVAYPITKRYARKLRANENCFVG